MVIERCRNIVYKLYTAYFLLLFQIGGKNYFFTNP